MTSHCHVSIHRHIGEHGAHRLQPQAGQHFHYVGRKTPPAIDLQPVVKAVQGKEVASLCVLGGIREYPSGCADIPLGLPLVEMQCHPGHTGYATHWTGIELGNQEMLQVCPCHHGSFELPDGGGVETLQCIRSG